MQGTVAVLDFMRMNRKILILFISLAPLSGGEEILQAVVVHMTLYTKKNLVRSVKNQVSRRVGVVEDSGAEVKHRRKGEEGLEGSQPLDKVTCSYGANYGSHCPDAVRHPCSSSTRDVRQKGLKNALQKCGCCDLLMLSCLQTYRAKIQRI